MKKCFTLLLAFLSISFLNFAQGPNTEGMNFEHLPSWKDVLAKAKQENKMVFLDCYTTWCGPCKVMSAQVFTKKEVGDFYNANFINAKVQLDTTAKDDEHVKRWYQDGHDIAKQYKVRAFPTYLIFNSQGEIVHRFVGSMPPAEFIAAGKEILNPDNQYYTQIKKYEAGDKSPATLLRIVELAQKAYDDAALQKYSEEYLATQSNLYTKENLTLLYSLTNSTDDKGFGIALNEQEKADKILEKPGASAAVVKRIVLNQEFVKLLRKDGDIDFTEYDKMLNEKYPKQAKNISDFSKMYYYRRKKNWDEFVKYADEVVKEGDTSPGNLNDYAWTVFENVTDKALLEKAANWSKESLKKDDNATFIDTHANLLYKLGKVKEAIAEEKRAMEVAKKTGGDVKWCEDTIAKMEKGEPTWPDRSMIIIK